MECLNCDIEFMDGEIKNYCRDCFQNRQEWQICPLCYGQGIVSKPSWVSGDVNTWISNQTSYICHLCNGAKVILRPQ
jgi:DnaJ-class molecular chaperone